MTRFSRKTDPSLKRFFSTTCYYAVFPKVGKGGFGIDGAYHSSTAFKDGQVVGETSVTRVSIGFELGGQAY